MVIKQNEKGSKGQWVLAGFGLNSYEEEIAHDYLFYGDGE